MVSYRPIVPEEKITGILIQMRRKGNQRQNIFMIRITHVKTNIQALEIFLSIVLLAIVLSFLFYYGRSNVKCLNAPRIQFVSKPDEAYTFWQESKINGRILLLFDRYLNAAPVDRREYIILNETLLRPDNYIYFAGDKNFIRKIYHIIPESSWPEVQQALSGWPLVTFSNEVYRMVTGEAIPVLILRAKDIPNIKEKVLISINGAYWGEQDIQQIIEILESKGLKSDIATLSMPISKKVLIRLQAFYGVS